MKNYKQIEKLLEEIDIDVSLEDEEIETFDELRDYLSDNGYFNVEIIYYANALDYLGKNDPSLQLSLGLAHDLGYETNQVNSELLASLLASENVQNDFSELEDEITELLN